MTSADNLTEDQHAMKVMSAFGILLLPLAKEFANSIKCGDGAKVYAVTDTFTSARAAEAERMARLEGKGPKRKPWRIARTESLGDATIVEFAEPVSVSLKEDASNHWAIMWTRDRSLFLICGPDREHIIDYYQMRHSGGAKKAPAGQTFPASF
jgi:hypothetical protein